VFCETSFRPGGKTEHQEIFARQPFVINIFEPLLFLVTCFSAFVFKAAASLPASVL
jgi:hypothetical protein